MMCHLVNAGPEYIQKVASFRLVRSHRRAQCSVVAALISTESVCLSVCVVCALNDRYRVAVVVLLVSLCCSARRSRYCPRALSLSQNTHTHQHYCLYSVQSLSSRSVHSVLSL